MKDNGNDKQWGCQLSDISLEMTDKEEWQTMENDKQWGMKDNWEIYTMGNTR